MSDDSDRLFYLGAGPIAAILLGVLLIPARGFTTASNFLTQPYLQLAIADKHDLVATLGIAGCGLLVATFASSRGRGRESQSGAADRER